MFRFISFLCLLIVSYTIVAQPSIQFKKTNHNFGDVANLNYPPAPFVFTNTGNQPLAILVVNKSPSVKVSYPKGYIQPGESERILVLPNLNQIGEFNETLSIITNASAEPEKIVITGNVLSIQACFPNQENMNIRIISVVDKDTKEPIANVNLNFTHNMSKNFSEKTNEKGKWTGEMPIGQYGFQLTADKYYPLNQDLFVNRSLPIIFFEMEMIPPALPEDNVIITDAGENISDEDFDFEINEELILSSRYAANNIILLLDVSFSMKSGNKIGLLKESSINLVSVLRSIDNVSLITYAGTPTIIFQAIPGDKKKELITKISALEAAGITNGVKGLESAYIIANRKFIPGGNNQIILVTDGKFTGGTQQTQEFKEMISGFANKGLILSIIGFGVDEEAKEFMAKMALLGQGTYIHVNTKDDISETLVNEIKQKSFIKE